MERLRRRWWTSLVTVGALILITGALLTASFQLIVQIAPGFREQLSDYVSASVGQPIEIGGISLGWSGLAPRLDLTDVTLFGADQHTPALSARTLRVGFGAKRLFHGDATPQHIELSGLELHARIDKQGQLSLRGIDTAGMPARATQDWLRELSRFKTVRLRDSGLKLDDARLQTPVSDFVLVDLKIEFSDGKGSARAELDLPSSIGSTVTFSADISGDLRSPETWNGKWSLELEKLRSLPWLNAALNEGSVVYFGSTHMQLEGTLDNGRLGDVSIDLDASRMEGHRGDHFTTLKDIRFIASLVPQSRGWILDVTEFAISGLKGPWPESRARLQLWRQDDGASQIYMQADYLMLGDIAPWFPLFRGLAIADARARLQSLDGEILGLSLDWRSPAFEDAKAHFDLQAEIKDMSLAGSERTPGFRSLSGSFSANQDGGSVTLDQSPFVIDFPRVFPQELAFDSISGALSWSQGDQDWQLSMPDFGWKLDGSVGSGSVKLGIPTDPNKSPEINLKAKFSAPDVRRFKAHIPLIWPEKLRAWLSQSIVSGRAKSGTLYINGDLSNFPFVGKPGTFALDLNFADGKLAFAPDWPLIDKLDAELSIRGNSLKIKGSSGRISGNQMRSVRAEIASFKESILTIDAEVEGDAGNFYTFLRESPLSPRLQGLTSRTQASGNALVQVALSLPLKQIKQTEVSGRALMRGATLQVTQLSEPIVDIHGSLSFDNRSVSAKKLTGRIYDTPFHASIGRENDQLWLHGNFKYLSDGTAGPLGALLPNFLHAPLKGSSHWTLDMPLDGDQAGDITMRSNLNGLDMSLPPPMQKPAEDSWPLTLRIESQRHVPLHVAVEIDNRLGVDLVFSKDAQQKLQLRRGRIRAGSGPAPKASEDGIRISGAVENLAPLDWIRLFKNPSGHSSIETRDTRRAADPAPIALSADLSVGHLLIAGQSVDSVRMLHKTTAKGWRTDLSGDGADGGLNFVDSAQGGTIIGRFEHMRLTHPETRSSEAETLAQDKQKTPPVHAPADPARLPVIDLTVAQMHLGDANLGQLAFLSQRVPHGQRIEKLRTTGGNTRLNVSGQWIRAAQRSSGDIKFSANTTQIDDVLEGLGYAPSIAAERSRMNGQFRWLPGDKHAPNGIVWSEAVGTLELRLKDGMLRTVKPGAGRVLGLLNFWAIPRRLSLDFRDVVSEGLGFDQIKGGFNISDGVAVTKDLNIDGPSLKMKVRGKVGLTDRSYDQRITVNPDMSSGVTLGALLLGGPAAAALAMIAQEVLDKPLEEVGKLSYQLTGSWDDPQVVKIGSK